jgi:predicted metal-dependent enzyme (double-stranded beta helix superfamily)
MLDGVFELGEAVERAYADCNYCDAALPRIAADALAKFDLQLGFDLQEIAAFLASTTVRQQSSQVFSDLQLTLYQRPYFYIEILIWSHATTSVHQHAFAGAFKVLQGSSLHTTFRFIQKHLVNPDCSLGELINQGSEFLAMGTIR